jgi:hypothetical protein
MRVNDHHLAPQGRQRPGRLLLTLAWAACSASFAQSSTSPAFPPASPAPRAVPPADAPVEMPLKDYLALLRQLAPAAESAAVQYMAAWRQRCGREMGTTELRRALSEGDGDPVLIALIRATHTQQHEERARLLRHVRCDRKQIR